MRSTRRDSAIWVLTSCFALPLVTMSIVWLNRPAPAKSAHTTVALNMATPSTPPIKDDDGDGDELLEHWNNPLFRNEQRVQIGGMAVFFVGAGLAAYRRRVTLRRFYRAH